jgi:hypothetical protein
MAFVQKYCGREFQPYCFYQNDTKYHDPAQRLSAGHHFPAKCGQPLYPGCWVQNPKNPKSKILDPRLGICPGCRGCPLTPTAIKKYILVPIIINWLILPISNLIYDYYSD